MKKKLILFAVAAVVTLAANAYDFMVDGLCYNINSDESSVTITYQMYQDNCGEYVGNQNLSGHILIPSTVTYNEITYSVDSIGFAAFAWCSDLTSITIPNSVTSIGAFAFDQCRGLTSVTIPNSVTSIGRDAFQSCEGLSSLFIPNSVDTIGYWAFSGCSNLTTVTIPISIMGENCFQYCRKIKTLFLNGDGEVSFGSGWGLTDNVQNLYIASGVTGIKGMQLHPSTIYCYASTPPVCDENSFTNYNGTLHVPASSVSAYFTADYWCNFGNIVGNAVGLSSITISQSSAELYGGDQLALTATLIPSNPTPNNFTWTSTNDAVATVNWNGVVTATGFGECDIIASCQGMQAQCHVTVVETQIIITLDQHAATIEPNQIITLTPTITPVSTELTVLSSNSAVAAARLMNNKVQIVGVAPGTAVITVAAVDGNAIPDSCLVTVASQVIAATSVTLDQEEAELFKGDTLTLTATVLPADATVKTVTWSTSNANVATVDSNGTVTAIGAGTAVITATTTDGTNLSDSCTITVEQKSNNGDVNGDGEINVIDITALIDIIMNS